MAESILESRSALAGVLVPGRHGSPGAGIGVTIRERRDLAIAHVAARNGQQAALAEGFAAQWGIALPGELCWAASDGLAALWIGPGQWLVTDETAAGRDSAGYDLAARLASGLTGLASVCDHSGLYTVLRVAGPRARDALAKGVQLDLHPRAFGPGRTAATVVHHIGVQIWQLDDAPSFDIALSRAFAGSFWEWLAASAREFGFEVAG